MRTHAKFDKIIQIQEANLQKYQINVLIFSRVSFTGSEEQALSAKVGWKQKTVTISIIIQIFTNCSLFFNNFIPTNYIKFI